MKITNVKAETIAACCAFRYRGYTISASTIFTPHAVCVYREGELAVDQDFVSVEEALKWVHLNPIGQPGKVLPKPERLVSTLLDAHGMPGAIRELNRRGWGQYVIQLGHRGAFVEAILRVPHDWEGDDQL